MKKNDSNLYGSYNEKVDDLNSWEKVLSHRLNRRFVLPPNHGTTCQTPGLSALPVFLVSFSWPLLIERLWVIFSHILPRLASKSIFSDYLPVIFNILTRVRHFVHVLTSAHFYKINTYFANVSWSYLVGVNSMHYFVLKVKYR